MRAPEDNGRRARIISVVAATAIALSCGTNYAFSAWEPQFAEKLDLTATQANLMGNFGNIGMYAMGIPGGIIIDSKGPRWGVLVGLIGLAVGYFSLHSAYEQGAGSFGLPALCFFTLLTGIASCTAFSAALKVAAMNWPNNRGTATGIPLSAFGLSAFFWTTFSAFVFPDDTSGYLLLVAIGTTSLVFVGMIFLKTVPLDTGYDAVSTEERRGIGRKDSQVLRRTSSASRRGDEDETASLVSSGPGDIEDAKVSVNHTRTRPDITGWAILRTLRFYQLWIMLGIGCGVGLMTINNIGNNTRQLWHHWDHDISLDTIQKAQLLQVGIISLMSFGGRLCSGIGSDWLVKNNMSRFWTLVVGSSIFTVAQVVAMTLQDPNHLWLLSGLTGLAYGQLFGVFPALVADAFGTSGMAINWGAMTLAPVVSGNFFNLAYGSILDSNSIIEDGPNGRPIRRCEDGKDCYASAYWFTFFAALFAIGWSLWCIRTQKTERLREARESSMARED